MGLARPETVNQWKFYLLSYLSYLTSDNMDVLCLSHSCSDNVFNDDFYTNACSMIFSIVNLQEGTCLW